MKQKMYSVEVLKGCSLFVIAYSKEHAIVEIVRMHIKDKIEDYPSEYTISNVKELSKMDMEDIIIDYNYATGDTESDTLLNIFKDLTKFKHGAQEFFGVVGDDFVAY